MSPLHICNNFPRLNQHSVSVKLSLSDWPPYIILVGENNTEAVTQFSLGTVYNRSSKIILVDNVKWIVASNKISKMLTSLVLWLTFGIVTNMRVCEWHDTRGIMTKTWSEHFIIGKYNFIIEGLGPKSAPIPLVLIKFQGI